MDVRLEPFVGIGMPMVYLLLLNTLQLVLIALSAKPQPQSLFAERIVPMVPVSTL
jgi:hypothetical protein